MQNVPFSYPPIASCERHGVDPQRYLTSVLAKIGMTPTDQLRQFLPDMWKAEDTAETMADHVEANC